jgi:hypothetical protein
MGLFNKTNKQNEPATEPTPVPPGNKDGQEVPDSIVAATKSILETRNPVIGLALVINELVSHGVVSAEDLTKIGISIDEVEAIVISLQESDTYQEFEFALETRAALRMYNAELMEIAAERGVSISGEAYIQLRSAIAEFAEQNEIYSLKLAYRLMLAECPERLPRP